MSSLRSQTPNVPPLYDPGEVLVLHPAHEVGISAVPDNIYPSSSPFVSGAMVQIVKIQSNSSTGNTEPLTSQTARYKIKAEVLVTFEKIGAPIKSERVPHDKLLTSPTAKASASDFYAADDVLYMKDDFSFALTVVKAGTKVVIDSGATTRKGNIARKVKDAYYQIRPITTVQEKRQYEGKRYVLHSELRKSAKSTR